MRTKQKTSTVAAIIAAALVMVGAIPNATAQGYGYYNSRPRAAAPGFWGSRPQLMRNPYFAPFDAAASWGIRRYGRQHDYYFPRQPGWTRPFVPQTLWNAATGARRAY
jgi:hypothetical protein